MVCCMAHMQEITWLILRTEERLWRWSGLQEPLADECFQKVRKISQILQTYSAVTEDLQDMFFIFCKTQFCNRDEIGLDEQLALSRMQAELKQRKRKIHSL